MISQLSQETVTEYASDAQTIQEPQGADYSRGVQVGKTVPAKWWNWLFNAVTKRASQSKTDAQNMLNELKNVVTDAGLTPDASDSTQMAQAVVAKTDAQIDDYVYHKQGFFADWQAAPVPEVPAGYWRSIIASPNASAACSVRFLATDAYTLTKDFIVSLNKDGTAWGDEVTVSITQQIYSRYNMRPQFCAFKGRYFLLLGGRLDTSSDAASQYDLFVSSDGTTWTKVKAIYLRNNIIQTSYQVPVLGLSKDTLYLIYNETVNNVSTSHLSATKDGYDWAELATGFSYGISPLDNEVIPYGTNGFAWGKFIYDGTSLTNAFNPSTSEVNYSIPNPVVFSSGKTVYIPRRNSSVYYIAPSLGAEAIRTTDMPQYRDWFMTPDKNYMIGIQGGDGDITCSLVKLVDDTLTATTMTQPPKQSTYTYRPFVKDGKIYCYRHTTTDFVTWTELSNLPPQVTVDDCLVPCLPADVLRFYRFNTTVVTTTGYVSINGGRTWRITNHNKANLKGVILNNNCCYDAALVTFTSINRVAGYTLYLR